jgi:hypothetical protein
MVLTKEYQLIQQKTLGLVYSTNKYAYLRLYVKYNSQSIENNTTNISIQARLYNDETWYASSGTSYQITGSGSLDLNYVGTDAGTATLSSLIIATESGDFDFTEFGLHDRSELPPVAGGSHCLSHHRYLLLPFPQQNPGAVCSV